MHLLVKLAEGVKDTSQNAHAHSGGVSEGFVDVGLQCWHSVTEANKGE